MIPSHVQIRQIQYPNILNHSENKYNDMDSDHSRFWRWKTSIGQMPPSTRWCSVTFCDPDRSSTRSAAPGSMRQARATIGSWPLQSSWNPIVINRSEIKRQLNLMKNELQQTWSFATRSRPIPTVRSTVFAPTCDMWHLGGHGSYRVPRKTLASLRMLDMTTWKKRMWWLKDVKETWTIWRVFPQ